MHRQVDAPTLMAQHGQGVLQLLHHGPGGAGGIGQAELLVAGIALEARHGIGVRAFGQREAPGAVVVGVAFQHTDGGQPIEQAVERHPVHGRPPAGQGRQLGDLRQAIALTLRQQAWVNALRQYLQVLAGAAVVEGVSLDAAESPLVQ